MSKAASRLSIALCLFFSVVIASVCGADSEVGIDYVDHGLTLNAQIPCTISLLIEADASPGMGQTPLDSTGFVGGAARHPVEGIAQHREIGRTGLGQRQTAGLTVE